jgi:delta-aminolevulinic acid dehydratase/porphobilinogen synthase
MRRFREWRANQVIRDLHAEVSLSVRDLICPFFIVDGHGMKQAIPARGTAYRFSVDRLLEELGLLWALGVDKILLFGVVEKAVKDDRGSAPSFGDRRTYQMDFRTSRQALAEVAADLEEGADWVMVKPALAYLDVLCRVRDQFPVVPLAAYHVSGECALLRLAAEQGLWDENQALLEMLFAMKRSGADYLITYYARRVAEMVKA